jgi:MFS transporter, NNP family, nitrate/nitrite transporter
MRAGHGVTERTCVGLRADLHPGGGVVKPVSEPSASPASARLPLASLLVAMLGYGLTFWAWSLMGPIGWVSERLSGIGGPTLTLLTVVTVAVGSVGRIPVGMLTDRYGPRVVLPALSLATALAVLALTEVGSGPVYGALAVALGVAGTTFAAGSALVVRAYPPAQRGMALTVFGAGMGIASIATLLTGQFLATSYRANLQVMAMILVGYAVLATVVIREQPERTVRHTDHGRIGMEVLRLPATRHLSAWYAVSFGGLVALGLYLPAYLQHVYHLMAAAPCWARRHVSPSPPQAGRSRVCGASDTIRYLCCAPASPPARRSPWCWPSDRR